GLDQRARGLVVGERDAQLEAGVSHEGIIPQNSARAALILRSARKNAAMLLGMRRISGRRRDAHIDAVVAYPHSHRPQPIFGVTAVAAGLGVEFPAVPGGDGVGLLGENPAPARVVRAQPLPDRAGAPCLTGPATVGP